MRIVIIGAGVLGASTAFHLAKMGAQVTVVDAHLDGRATAAGAGIICPWVSGVEDQAFYRLYVGGGEYYPDLIAALSKAGETDLGYRRAGAMLVSDDEQELAWIEHMTRQRAAAAMGKVTRLAARQAQALFPPLRQGLGGIHVAGGARVDGRRLTAALLRAAKVHGAVLVKGKASLAVEANRVRGVEVAAVEARGVEAGSLEAKDADTEDPKIGDWEGRGERIPADRVIVTAGAWANAVLAPFAPKVTVEPQRGQIAHLRLEAEQTDDWPVILPPGSHYIVPFEAGRIVVGATREAGAGFDYRVTASGQAELLSEALRIAPGLATATMIETRVGFRPVGAGVRPLLGWVEGIDGLAVGNGLGAAGLTIGPFAGRLLADLVTGQPGPMNLEPFDPTQRTGALAVLR